MPARDDTAAANWRITDISDIATKRKEKYRKKNFLPNSFKIYTQKKANFIENFVKKKKKT